MAYEKGYIILKCFTVNFCDARNLAHRIFLQGKTDFFYRIRQNIRKKFAQIKLGKEVKMQKIKNSFNFFAVIIICFSLIITAAATDSLVPLGHTTGIKLDAGGAIVIGMSEDVDSNPCRSAGISEGDVIKSINGKRVYSNSDLKNAVLGCEGNPLKIEYVRNGKTETAEVTPTKNESGEFVLGIWIRDSIAGIGTLTYYDPETRKYGALGHGVSDSDTNLLIPIERGSLMNSTVAGVKRGSPGNPGELIGEYDLSHDFADIKKNTESGIFGTVSDFSAFENMKTYPVAKREEIHRGKATILSNLEGDKIEEYQIEITSIYFDGEKTKNMLIRATDPRLIEKTGGIVRGMSGSPILQDGKIVGAVTHVLVNDPKKGYAIFIENMLSEAA
ncbi:MAG: SpoIVB peptidase [Oscillospiraceae bacterium]|nr:SpoIVB peptidase [Oscillospiraceae bacterium]MBQ4544279.1 SpoIVB peptidase [Oscillospiraceae bacterium]